MKVIVAALAGFGVRWLWVYGTALVDYANPDWRCRFRHRRAKDPGGSTIYCSRCRAVLAIVPPGAARTRPHYEPVSQETLADVEPSPSAALDGGSDG